MLAAQAYDEDQVWEYQQPEPEDVVYCNKTIRDLPTNPETFDMACPQTRWLSTTTMNISILRG